MTKAMVLAAGVGSRLEPISSYIPKPLVPVLNRPVVSHILSGLRKHNISKVIMNTHYLSEKLMDYFQNNQFPGMELQFRFEAELSGDAGGVRACREFFDDGTFVVIMGDLMTSADITRLLNAHKEKKAIATIGVKKMQDVTRFGVMRRDANGFIKEFQEKPKAEEAISHDISTGIYILEPEVFDHIPASGMYGFGKQLFPTLVEKGLAVLGEDIGGYWSDIGTLAELFRGNMDALSGAMEVEKPENHRGLYNMAQIADNVMIGANVEMGEGVVIGERSIIGDGCVIGKNASLRDCVVLGGSHIEEGLVLKNCIYAFGEHVEIASP